MSCPYDVEGKVAKTAPLGKASSKRAQINQARLEDARAQVARAEARLAAVDAELSKFHEERIEVKKELEQYNAELAAIETEIANCAMEDGPPPIQLKMQGRAVDVTSPNFSSAIWEKRHEAVAANFCKMLFRIKKDGAHRFQDSMWSLWQAAEALHPLNGSEDIDPTTHSLYSYYHVIADLRPLTARKRPLETKNSPYGEISQRWLLSFEAMARQLKDEHATIFEENGVQASALKKMVAALSKGLDKPGTRLIRNRNQSSRMPPFGLSRDTAEVPKELASSSGAWAVLPLVWLPLALYVRSTTHLYEMLDRLHHMQTTTLESALEPNAEEALRGVLDRD